MKRFKLFGVFLILSLSVGLQHNIVANDTPKVLLFITDGSPELEFMLTKEVGVMKKMLEQSGFEVDIATVSGEVISTGSVRLDTILKLANVNTDDYSGFIIPCMGVSERDATEIEPFIKKAVEAGKPVAVQLASVKHLARAGVLKGKKYAYRTELDLSAFPEFKGAIYSGTGIVRDENIITSGVCPLWSRENGLKDGTSELTRALIEAMRKNLSCEGQRHVGKPVLIEHEVIDSGAEAFLQEMEKEEHFTGVALVMRKKEVIHAKGYGRANGKRANSVTTAFHVASMTKQFTAAAISHIPADLLSDEQVLGKLPIFFRTIRGEKPSRKELEELIRIMKEE